MTILEAAILASAIAALWDTGRRWLTTLPVSRETAARMANIETRLGFFRQHHSDCLMFQSDQRETVSKLFTKVHDMALRLDAYAAKHEGLRSEHERILDEHEQQIGALEARPNQAGADVIVEIHKQLREQDTGIKEAIARCDKNTSALENGMKSMQTLLNEKFTAVAIQRGINQGKAG